MEAVPSEREELNHVLCDVTAGDIHARDEVREEVVVVDRHNVRDTVAGVDNDAGREALRVQHEERLRRELDSLEAVLLEEDLHELLSVLERVQRRFGDEDLVLLRVDLQLLVPEVLEDELLVFPVLDDAVLDGVREVEVRARLVVDLVADHLVLELLARE